MPNPYYQDEQVTLLLGDALEQLRTLPDGSVDCIVTSPPYYALRDYGTPGQYGLEATPAAYVETMRSLFAEARRVLADDGTLWLNLGDSYVAGPSGKRRSSGLMGRSQAITTPEGSGDKSRCGVPAKSLIGIPCAPRSLCRTTAGSSATRSSGTGRMPNPTQPGIGWPPGTSISSSSSSRRGTPSIWTRSVSRWPIPMIRG
jgi:hypothetical protein